MHNESCPKRQGIIVSGVIIRNKSNEFCIEFFLHDYDDLPSALAREHLPTQEKNLSGPTRLES